MVACDQPVEVIHGSSGMSCDNMAFMLPNRAARNFFRYPNFRCYVIDHVRRLIRQI